MIRQEVTKRLLVKRSTGTQVMNQCSVIATLKVFGTKWKPCILCYLSEGPLRYNDLYRVIPNISRKILSEHLSELIRDELVTRTQFDDKLQRVEYALTDKGRSLFPIMEHLQDWGMRNIKDVLTIEEMLKTLELN